MIIQLKVVQNKRILFQEQGQLLKKLLLNASIWKYSKLKITFETNVTKVYYVKKILKVFKSF